MASEKKGTKKEAFFVPFLLFKLNPCYFRLLFLFLAAAAAPGLRFALGRRLGLRCGLSFFISAAVIAGFIGCMRAMLLGAGSGEARFQFFNHFYFLGNNLFWFAFGFNLDGFGFCFNDFRFGFKLDGFRLDFGFGFWFCFDLCFGLGFCLLFSRHFFLL